MKDLIKLLCAAIGVFFLVFLFVVAMSTLSPSDQQEVLCQMQPHCVVVLHR